MRLARITPRQAQCAPPFSLWVHIQVAAHICVDKLAGQYIEPFVSGKSAANSIHDL